MLKKHDNDSFLFCDISEGGMEKDTKDMEKTCGGDVSSTDGVAEGLAVVKTEENTEGSRR